jgi:glycolate oxidase
MGLTKKVLSELGAIVGPEGLVASPEGRLTYECDMHTFYKAAPDAVCLPTSAEQVVAVVRVCLRDGIPVVPRGAGTGIIGGATAPRGGVMVSTSRMTRILEVDLPNRSATVEPGLINLWLTQAVQPRGYFFAPDPSSQMVSSIGGNISTNAGGPHCLKYGITVNHVLGLELVTGAGEVVRLGGKVRDRPGYDLTGVAVGAEGTFGIVTRVTVRLLHLPEAVETILAVFATVEEASAAVSGIIARGIIPAALEIMDEPVIRAVEEGVGAGYPKGAGAVLLIELDGPREETIAQRVPVVEICRARSALDLRVAEDDAERALLWKGRKSAAGAFGRLGASWMLQDAVVPRSRLPEIMRRVSEIGRQHRVLIANVFHAGDGNLHPVIFYDEGEPDQVARAVRANEEVLEACLAMGGSVTGEHGVGMDKAKNLPRQYGPADLDFMARLRRVFDPRGLMNPGKVLPDHAACGEALRPPGGATRVPRGAWV